jgi:hypothetical protein
MDIYWNAVVSVIVATLASSGLWAYVASRSNKKSDSTKLLLGMAHGRMIEQGMVYLRRGWVSTDEYQDYKEYLYDPYKSLGGAGVVDRLMEELAKLPIRSHAPYEQALKEGKYDANL